MRDKVIDWCCSSFVIVLWEILPGGLARSINQGQPGQPAALTEPQSSLSAGACLTLHSGKELVLGVKIPSKHLDFVRGKFYGGTVRLLRMGDAAQAQNHRID